LTKNNKRKKLYLIDGMALIYRAHFALINNPLMTSEGKHTSAIYGFFNSILKIIKSEKPDYFAVVLDSKEPTFRHELYKDYKATRETMPLELVEQIQPILDILKASNFFTIRKPGYEADDIIGTISKKMKHHSVDTYIVSGDKDLMQLVNNNTFLYSPGNRFKPTTVYDKQKVLERWGVEPNKIIEFLALMGDASDNIPGVEGVGKKTAKKLLDQYHSIHEIIENAENIKNKRVSSGLVKAREYYETSLKLVTLDIDVPIDFEMEDLKRVPANKTILYELIKNYELFSLQKQIDDVLIETTEKNSSIIEKKKYHLIKTLGQLKSVLKKYKKNNIFSINTVSTSNNPHHAKLVGISISFKKNEGYYIPIIGLESKKLYDLKVIIDVLNPLLINECILKCGQNIKYDVIVLENAGFKIKGIGFDTMIAAHLLNPSINEYKLDFLSEQFLGYSKTPISNLIGEGKNVIKMDKVSVNDCANYAAENSDITLQLYDKLKSTIKKEHLYNYYKEIELPLVSVLVEMEKNGVYIDCDFLQKLSHQLERKLKNSETEIFSLAGKDFNINSPKQLAEILFDEIGLKKVRKRSTDVNVLETLQNFHPLPEKILEYRQYKKLKSTYTDALPSYVNSDTKRVHTSWNQTITTTGRLSSTNPNFQNIPIRTILGKEVRKAIRPQKQGWSLMAADYSQIELRVMAHLSGEKVLINAFQNGDDIHSRTASNVFKTPINKINDSQRRTAKIVNFGIMYGAGPYRMSQELGISMFESRELIDNYFDTYPGIRNFIDKTLKNAKEDGFVKTMNGRKRKIKFLNTGNKQQINAESRVITNMPIQGTASEIIKIAMIKIHKKLKEKQMQSKMIMQVHDELIFEFPNNESKALKNLIIEEMESAMKLDVPLKIDIGIGKHWFDAH